MIVYIVFMPPLQVIDGTSVRANFQAVGIWNDGTVREVSLQTTLGITQNVSQERAAILTELRATALTLYPDLVIPANPTIRWLGI